MTAQEALLILAALVAFALLGWYAGKGGGDGET